MRPCRASPWARPPGPPSGAQRFWDKISYPAWTRRAETLASGPPQEIFELDDELQQVASAGIEAILAGPAAAAGLGHRISVITGDAMAGEFAAHIRTGDVYSVEEVRGWLDHTGWRFADDRPLAGPQSLVIAQAA